MKPQPQNLVRIGVQLFIGVDFGGQQLRMYCTCGVDLSDAYMCTLRVDAENG